jgi:succinate-acetate transporter protein
VVYSTEAGYVKYSPEEVVDAVVAAAAFPGGLSNLFACIVSAVVYF